MRCGGRAFEAAQAGKVGRAGQALADALEAVVAAHELAARVGAQAERGSVEVDLAAQLGAYQTTRPMQAPCGVAQALGLGEAGGQVVVRPAEEDGHALVAARAEHQHGDAGLGQRAEHGAVQQGSAVDDHALEQGERHVARAFVGGADAQTAGLQFQREVAAVEHERGHRPSPGIEVAGIVRHETAPERAYTRARVEPEQKESVLLRVQDVPDRDEQVGTLAGREVALVDRQLAAGGVPAHQQHDLAQPLGVGDVVGGEVKLAFGHTDKPCG